RDLLADGLVAEAGEGDVRIRPRLDSSGLVMIELSSPSGQATFEVDADQLVEFLNDTYDAVAPGDEHRWMNFDETLSRLLSHNL
ncbi:SsgA family sporulation/cell division regulator, partial [Saccharopolyspora sp. NPDC000995]